MNDVNKPKNDLPEISDDELRRLAELARCQPKRDGSYRVDGKLEVYRGSFDVGEPEKAIFVDPLRIYAEAKLPQRGIPLYDNLVEALLRREGAIDPEAVNSKVKFQPEPIIVAEHFYGQHRHEIVDGNHTYVAFAVACLFGQSNFSLPSGMEPTVPGYVVPISVWRDFLAVISADGALRPKDRRAISQRLEGISHDLPSNFV